MTRPELGSTLTGGGETPIACTNCNADIPAGQKFCGECGTRAEAMCPTCGASAPPNQKFCGECGGALTDLAAAPAEATSTTASVGAERRLVSVLFLDLAGFTPFTESRDAEDVRAFITRYFDAAKQIIERFGGVVDKYIGDAVMAIWGATRAEEDDAERSVRAGLELIDMVAKLGADEGATGMAARAGIMTGEASVGPGGNDTGLVLGDIVNTASRLQSIGDPGEVLVGQTTHDLTIRSIQYTEVGERPLKGKEDSVRVFRAERILAERGGVGRADVIEAPFVGRDEELRLLKDQLHAAGREGRSRLVSIVGQAGIGKSRLVWEFEKYIDGLVENVFWHHGRAPSYGDGLAMWSLAEMVRSRCKMTETEDPEAARGLLDEALSTYLRTEERTWVEPQLLALLGLAQAGGERSEMHAAIRLFFERIAEVGTTVLVFEDLHWADAATLELVEELTEWSRDFPILVVALARPDLLELRPTWGSLQRGVVALHLPPLADTEMHRLVSSLIPALDNQSRANIVNPAGGIPLFAVEMVRMLLNEGRLAPQANGTFSPIGDVSNLSVPDSVQAIIGARLDRLDAADRQLVQDAAVLGQTFTITALAALSPEGEDDVAQRLASLARRELFEVIRDPRSPERGQYGFVQSVIREVAHGRINRDVRRQKHVEVAQYLETLGAEDAAGAIASHYLDAIELVEPDADLLGAVSNALMRAVDRARTVHAYEQVVTLAERAGLSIGDPARLVPLWIAAAEAASALSDVAQGESFASRLIDHYRESGDAAGLAMALATLGEVLNGNQQATRVVDLLEPHFDPAAPLPETEGHARLAASLARAYLLTGKGQAEGLASQALVVAEHLELDEVAADAMITKGTELVDARRPREGRGLIAAGVQIAEAHGLTHVLLRGLANSAYTAETNQEGMDFSGRGLAEARRAGDKRHIHFFAYQRAGFLPDRGRLDELEELAADPIIALGDASVRSQIQGALAYGYLTVGNTDAADQAWQEATDLISQTDDFQTLGSYAGTEIYRELHVGSLSIALGLAEDLVETYHGRHWITVAAWAPWLIAKDPTLIARYGELTALLPAVSALSPFRDLGDAAAQIVDTGSSSTALGLKAIRDLVDGQLFETAAVGAAILASYLPPGVTDRGELESTARSLCEDHGFHGTAALIERILSGEFLTA